MRQKKDCVGIDKIGAQLSALKGVQAKKDETLRV